MGLNRSFLVYLSCGPVERGTILLSDVRLLFERETIKIRLRDLQCDTVDDYSPKRMRAALHCLVKRKEIRLLWRPTVVPPYGYRGCFSSFSTGGLITMILYSWFSNRRSDCCFMNFNHPVMWQQKVDISMCVLPRTTTTSFGSTVQWCKSSTPTHCVCSMEILKQNVPSESLLYQTQEEDVTAVCIYIWDYIVCSRFIVPVRTVAVAYGIPHWNSALNPSSPDVPFLYLGEQWYTVHCVRTELSFKFGRPIRYKEDRWKCRAAGLNSFSIPVYNTGITTASIFSSRYSMCVSSEYRLSTNSICSKSRSLRGAASRMCRQEPELMRQVNRGTQIAIDECQANFKYRKWDCKTSHRTYKKILKAGMMKVYPKCRNMDTSILTDECSTGDRLAISGLTDVEHVGSAKPNSVSSCTGYGSVLWLTIYATTFRQISLVTISFTGS